MLQHGFLRVAVVAPELEVANVHRNTQHIAAAFSRAVEQGASVVLFPELAFTGYTCGDLFFQRALLHAVKAELLALVEKTKSAPALMCVGLPLEHEGRLFNVAVLIGAGRIWGIVPKTFLPNTCEYYEQRWFTSGASARFSEVPLGDHHIPFGTDLLFDFLDTPSCRIGVEICEDLWAVQPPSGPQALAGANLILNPSASTELLGKAPYRRELVLQQSARCLAAYLYAASGPGESTTDVVFAGHCLIAENGSLLAETERFQFETQMALQDIDLERLSAERHRNSSFAQAIPQAAFRHIAVRIPRQSFSGPLLRKIARLPFVPSDPKRRSESCAEIFQIQSTGLAKRLKHTMTKRVVIGISGGLDSTLALLVARHAVARVGLEPSAILGVTMPGLGTTSRTRSNAEKLTVGLGAEFLEVPIAASVLQHFKDIGQSPEVHDITFENAQARERTQILMDMANQRSGIVLGTGDLSEAALGWCTFNGDHMSMYHINIGVPKTLVRYLIQWCSEQPAYAEVASFLVDILDTPISPELLPPSAAKEIAQKTEEVVGPYELHDFFLYWMIRHQCPADKVYYLACHAFDSGYTPEEIKRWLTLFIKRFISQQFKRSAMPDGPKVGSLALSPRGDWRMPSDASAELFLKSLEP